MYCFANNKSDMVSQRNSVDPSRIFFMTGYLVGMEIQTTTKSSSAGTASPPSTHDPIHVSIVATQPQIIEVGTILWAVINGLLLVFIIGGNTLTITAVRRCRRLRAIISNIFILSLAVSDLIVGMGLPFHVSFYLGTGLGNDHYLCLLRFFLLLFGCCVSVLTLISIAIDRYIAIVYALHYRRYMTRRVAYVIITSNWFFGAFVASIPMFWNHWKTSVHCEFDEILPYGYIVGVITPGYILIWSFMLLLYCRIMREASKQARQIPCGSDWKSIQIVVLIMSLFTICWLPYFIVVCAKTFEVHEKSSYVYKATFTLAMSNSGWNPIIYAWKNRNFRRAFIQILCCRDPNQRRIIMCKPLQRLPHCIKGLEHSDHEEEELTYRTACQAIMPPGTLKGIYFVPLSSAEQTTTIAAHKTILSHSGHKPKDLNVCVICKSNLFDGKITSDVGNSELT